jgi:steroid 5-alpha reductase family enzyme
MSLSFLTAILFALCAVMALAFLLQQRTGNSGWVDVLWTFGTGTVIAGALVLELFFAWRAPVVAALVLLWALRLGAHIAARSLKVPDDPRYAAMIEAWGPAAPRRLFQFLQAQALASFVLALSCLAAALNPSPPGWLDGVAVLVALGALAGEAVADRQLRAAKAAGEAICQRGLWGYSRHPNYFFEFLFWCALPLFAFAGGGPLWPGVLSLLAPAQMYYLLTQVSGVPPLEAHMQRKHGAAFAAYAAQVSVFFPRWPRPEKPAQNVSP